MNEKKAILLGLVSATIFILLLSYALPAEDNYSVKNPKGNGLTKLETKHNTTPITNRENIQKTTITPTQSTLIIIGPTKQYSPIETKNIEKFLKNGGRVILADDYGSGNDLLKKLNTSARFSNHILKDPLFKLKNSKLPTVNTIKKTDLTENISSIGLNYGTILENLGNETKILALSSKNSYIADNAEANYEQNIGVGPFPVIAKIGMSDGELILLSDSSVFINSMLPKENNELLLDSLIGDRVPYLDVHHWEISPHLKIKRTLIKTGNLLSIPVLRYGLLFLVTIVIFKFGREKKEGKPEKRKKPIDATLKKHPDWDKDLLKKLEEEMENEN